MSRLIIHQAGPRYRHSHIVLTFFICAWFAQPSTFLAATTPQGNPRLMQGPMVGSIREDGMQIWVRLSGPFPAFVEYSPEADFSHSLNTPSLTAAKSEDYILKFALTDLKPASPIYYRVWVAGRLDPTTGNGAPFVVNTAPVGPARFRVAFGSCAKLRGQAVDAIWATIPPWNPDLFFWLGDNIYGDALDPDILAEEYRRLRDASGLARVWGSMGHLATWDDHDFGLNDSDRTHPGKAAALEVFTRYWANPRFGLEHTPGVFFQTSYGGVDFFFLDGRTYRDPNDSPDSPEKTFLGAAQMAWLRNGLRASRAPFKVLISGSGWSTAKLSGDSWGACLHERDALFDFIRDEKIAGVVLLSGDTHSGELNAIPWSERGGYDFYDLVSSPLVQTSRHTWVDRRPEIRVRQAFDATPNFGLIEFDLIADRPSLRFQLINQTGKPVWSPFVVYADELVNGVESWPAKIDADSRQRLERERSGRPYYR
ncbi:MAG: alkaline phosphatase D family protein [Opitutaceae bacterium]|nr:alkaline phosphatase D family protein [Opitutaceae bacterium]